MTRVETAPGSSVELPWRFLETLDADRELDRRLIEATRAKDLELITGMVASSSASLLYASSGVGKSSLIAAGVLPHFRRQGYAVFRSRPRPPWSLDDPCAAFKECLIRDLSVPVESRRVEMLSAELREQIAELPHGRRAAILRQLEGTQKAIEAELATERVKGWREALSGLSNATLHEFVTEVRKAMQPDAHLLIVCDQFEEAFVHFENTRGLERFIGELGELWSDSELRCHLLFSMRAEWVGHMISFRRDIPDIFSQHYKLSPLRKSEAVQVLDLPLEGTGYAFSEELRSRLLDDLSAAYESYDRSSLADTRQVQRKDDPYLELPSLHIVCNRLWETKDGAETPFSVGHYEALANGADSAPSQVVLDAYLRESVARASAADGNGKLADLRLDCLYLLTDRFSHRRALSGVQLEAELKKAVEQEPELPAIDAQLLERLLQPMVERRLVRQGPRSDGGLEYELAHDFLVRSVLTSWEELDRRRTAERAVREHAQRLEQRQLHEKLSTFDRTRGQNLRASFWLALYVTGLGLWVILVRAFAGTSWMEPAWELWALALGACGALVGLQLTWRFWESSLRATLAGLAITISSRWGEYLELDWDQMLLIRSAVLVTLVPAIAFWAHRRLRGESANARLLNVLLSDLLDAAICVLLVELVDWTLDGAWTSVSVQIAGACYLVATVAMLLRYGRTPGIALAGARVALSWRDGSSRWPSVLLRQLVFAAHVGAVVGTGYLLEVVVDATSGWNAVSCLVVWVAPHVFALATGSKEGLQDTVAGSHFEEGAGPDVQAV